MDMRDINTQNLLFLLTAAPLSVGCVITDGDDETTTTSPTTSATGTTSPTTGATGDTTGGSGDGSSGGDTTTTTDPTVSDTGTGSTTEPGTTTEGEVVECGLYGDNIEYCYDADAGTAAEEYCLEVLAGYYEYSPDCAAAGLAYFACLSNLSCDDLSLPVDEICVPEQEGLDAACGGA